MSPTKCKKTTQMILEADPETHETLLEVHPDLICKLKPHQVQGVQFLWDCCVETMDRMKKEEGSGCILAHCMGLGKTLTVITFLHTLLYNKKITNMRTCLIVCPLNTVLNWEVEWFKWLDKKLHLKVYELSSVKSNIHRADMLSLWQRKGGVLIMGYEMYRNLIQGNHVKKKKLKEIFQRTLVDPGPDLVACDEGHILKNDATGISKAMTQLRTKRRIVLTGTPLQNNLIEYHCMANFVKPNLLGTRKEFSNRFVNPITNGQCRDSTAWDVKVMKNRAHVLHDMLNGCVQRKDYSALTKFLPPKYEYVMLVRLSKIQMDMYQAYLERERQPDGTIKGGKLFSDYQMLMQIWTHPWVLKMSEIRQEEKRKYDSSDEEEESLDSSFIGDSESDAKSSSPSESEVTAISLSDSETEGPKRRSQKIKEEPQLGTKTRSRHKDSPSPEIVEELRPISREWWAKYINNPDDQFRIDYAGKLVLLFEILKMCEEIGDKVLIFSQSLLSLDLIEDYLAYMDEDKVLRGEREAKQVNGDTAENKDKENEKNDSEDTEMFGKTWIKGDDYYRMDGSTSVALRQQWAESFNDPENYKTRLFLISTRAGSLGINLVAANRVILFDASWNPSHDIQSIFRVYRFGQVKPCYVYRLLAQGTMEEKIYERQVTKQSLSQRVLDEHQIASHFTRADLQELYNFQPDRLDDPNRPERPTPTLPKDTLLAELLKIHQQWYVTHHEHDSLLVNQEEQTLTEEERKAAWDEYENEKKGIMARAALPENMMQKVPLFMTHLSQFNALPGVRKLNIVQIVQQVRAQFPNLPPLQFQAQVQAIVQYQIAQQVRQRQAMERQQMQYEQQLMLERNQLRLIQEQQKRLLQQHQAGGAGNMSGGAGNMSGGAGNMSGGAGNMSGGAGNMSASSRLSSLLNHQLRTEVNSNGDLHIVSGSIRPAENHSPAPDTSKDSSVTTS